MINNDKLTPFHEVLEEQLKSPEFRALWEQRHKDDLVEEEALPEPTKLTGGVGWCAPSA